MRKTNNTYGLGFAGALLLGAAMCLWTAGTAVAAEVTGEQYCEVSMSKCPNEYDGDTLKVPLSVVSISSKIKACADTSYENVRVGKPPAIMFVIDHSTSMVINGDCANGCDPSGRRFETTRRLIDSIAGIYPSAEVGIVIFSNGLVLNKLRDANLVTYPNVEPSDSFGLNQAYMPLKPLNAPALAGGFLPAGTANPTVLDVYRKMFVDSSFTRVPLATQQNPNPTPVTTNGWGISGGPVEIGGTNISLAFAAAQRAFETSQIDKDNQFIIFLSDGDAALIQDRATTCTGHVWCGHRYDFVAGANTPTTYTLFLRGNVGGIVPDSLNKMTNAIKANGYSETNKSSLIQAVTANTNNMLDTLKNAIFKNMPVQTASNARRISVATWGRPDTVDNVGGDEFAFNRMLPLDTSVVAPVKMGIWYEVTEERDTILNGVQQIVTVTSVKEQGYNFWIQRTDNPPPNWTNQGLTPRCAIKPTITVWWDSLGNGNLVEVKVIKPNMTKLVVKFDKKDDFYGEYTLTPPNGVVIEISTTAGSKLDTLYTTSLTPKTEGTSYLWEFSRNGNATPNEIVVRNSALEHNSPNDVIAFHFRNPLIPLDEILVEIPYISYDLVFKTSIDGVAQPGYIRVPPPNKDTITVQAGKRLDITAILLDWDDKVETGLFNAGSVTWTLSNYDDATLEPTEGPSTVFTGTRSGKFYDVTAKFENGDLEIERKFTVKVKPGDPTYLEIVFANPKTNPPPAWKSVSEIEKNKTLALQRGAKETVVFVVERDEYGNLIVDDNGKAGTPGTWDKVGDAIIIGGGRGYRDSSAVSRQGIDFSAGNLVIVTNGTLRPDTVEVTVVGNASTAVGPNPFIPGVSNPADVLKTPAAKEYYDEIIKSTPIGGGGGGGSTGILIAGTAQKAIDTSGNGKAKLATVIIYDAVGNIVFKSKPGDVTVITRNNTFGFVWNGKNNKGRTVAPGTYLVRMHVQLDNGKDKFVEQRKIGVTKSK